MSEKLYPRSIIHNLTTSRPFVEQLANADIQELPPEDRRHFLGRAMANAAIEKSEQFANVPGKDLEADMYSLIGCMPDFFESQRVLDDIREKYKHPHDVPPDIKQAVHGAKKNLIRFNHALHEVVNSGASAYDFDGLLDFMTTMHGVSHPESITEFRLYAKSALNGVRNEMAFEQILLANGIDYMQGTPEEDAMGGDFIIDGVPIDVKASLHKVEKTRRRARDPHRIIWSHITQEDFDGGLTLPFEKARKIYTETDLKQDIEDAVHP
jgi:hypothetical protein